MAAVLTGAGLSAGRTDYPKARPHIWEYNLYKAAQLLSDPLTGKSLSYDSHYFHTGDENIQSEPNMDASL